MATPLMPLREVQPGMEGEWHTVVDREGLKQFRLRVLGIARNMIGPKRDIILCEALDPSQIVSGPVAGMSGSPVYIDGKLVGAYAYGFSYAKEQAIIGVQPIEHMLEVLDYGDESSMSTAQTVAGAPRSQRQNHAPQTSWQWVGEPLPHALSETLSQPLQPLPVVLTAAGFSPETLQAFATQARALGVQFMQTAGGGSSEREYPLEPGMPVAGVLMGGDFNIAGTGTITWREGNRILAFGHPLFQWGAVDIPMAGAEILTVIQNIISSFKFSNAGKAVGAIYQDRQTAILGEVGRVAVTTPLEIAVETPVQGTQHYQTAIIRDQRMSPLLIALALMQSTVNAMSAERKQTVFMEGTLNFEQLGTLHWSSVAGEQVLSSLLDLNSKLSLLLNNPFERVQIEQAHFRLRVREGWGVNRLRSAHLLTRGEVRAGDTLRLRYALEHAQQAISEHTATIVLPEDLRPGVYKLRLLDAQGYDHLRYGAVAAREDFRNAQDYFDAIADSAYRGNAYWVLTQADSGVRVDGHSLYSLPASTQSLILDAESREPTSKIREQLLKTEILPTDGEFIILGHAPNFQINVMP